MWAPEGYLPFPAIEQEIKRIVADANPSIGISRALYEARRLRLLDFAWGDFLESCRSLSLSSPSGTVMRISADIGMRVREPLSNGGFANVWMFLKADRGIVDTTCVSERARKARLLLAGHMAGLDPEFAFPDSLNEYQWSCLNVAAESDELLPMLSNFEGWALCCQESDRPKIVLSDFPADFADLSFDDWDDMFAKVPAVQGSGTASVAAGRPSKQPQVLSVYRNCFPEGHDGVPWKTVLSRLESAGVICKVDTLRRAIKSEMKGN